ncbi:MAG: signal peptidase II [Eubacterium sp.]|jgi:Lipoprotein signal peptidase|nr:signal peptidase II [Eubacterium sp.]
MIFPFITAAVFATDYFVKKKVNTELKSGDEKEILGGHVVLNKCTNKGFACNFLEENPDLVKKITMFICAMIGCLWVKELFCRKHPVRKLGLSFLLGGGLMNLYDRHQNGEVTDYFSFKGKDGKKGKLAYNLSDMFIFLGSILTAVDN